MLILIDNYDSFTYNLYQALSLMTEEIQVFRHDAISVNDIINMKPSGIVLSPGPGRPEDAGICIELIQKLSASSLRLPLLGVCLGHQALVTAFGGDVIGAPSIVHGKSDLIYHENGRLYQSLSNPFKAGRYHSLMAQKTTLPRVLKVDAWSKEGLIMGVSHETLPLYGVQFHPESILSPEGPKLLEAFIRETVC